MLHPPDLHGGTCNAIRPLGGLDLLIRGDYIFKPFVITTAGGARQHSLPWQFCKLKIAWHSYKINALWKISFWKLFIDIYFFSVKRKKLSRKQIRFETLNWMSLYMICIYKGYFCDHVARWLVLGDRVSVKTRRLSCDNNLPFPKHLM